MANDERRTTNDDDDGHQPIAIGHLSDLGDLKTCSLFTFFVTAKFQSQSFIYHVLIVRFGPCCPHIEFGNYSAPSYVQFTKL